MKLKTNIAAAIVLALGVVATSIALGASESRSGRGSRQSPPGNTHRPYTCDPGCLGGGDGGVPTPVSVNQKVELADGESYLLVGWVRYLLNPTTLIVAPYLEVDLNEHAWLASARRRAYPYYPIEIDTNDWKYLENRKIKAVFTAAAAIIPGDVDGKVPSRYEIRLVPDGEPVPVRRR